MSTLNCTTYLSRVTAPRGAIDSDYAAHRLLWRAYGLDEQSRGQVQPFRYRKEESAGVEGHTAYLVQSAQQPDWESVLGLQAQCKRLEFELQPERTLHFRLLANVERHDTAKGRKVAITEPSLIRSWLDRQAQKHGFEVVSTLMGKTANDVHSAYEKGSTGLSHHERRLHVFKLNRIRFDGVLRVTDPEKMANALKHGVGPKAAFGCGMLSVSN